MFDYLLTVAGSTDVGRVRTNNQDAYHLDVDSRFFVLADGMGGYTGGEVASALAVKTIAHHLDRFLQERHTSVRLPQDWLNRAVLLANEAVLQDAQAHPQRADMGTTIVAVLPLKSMLWFAHVGDSRLYRFRDGQLQQLTADHTLVADMVTHGLLEAHEARRHPYRNVLSRCLGRPDLKQATVNHVLVQPEDRFLLCSDGLTEEVTDAQIAEALSTYPIAPEACQNLVEQANQHGGRDNVTVVVLSIHKQDGSASDGQPSMLR
ncbi:Stp1/IreP family PP2C-type Ser/Thr phosphatase [Anthocerotibacter panamensis]|uniref:Stp1/IreP family PP2C-type Ser/Thr phosphatase n=1 Tax=Anthocerotibacter panamensis TaxID=2857077 RepID=UPI001C40211D|nr:Stp1/IreP family PP2C-type Ser/Thr phosphatase [Anthocerotibacter panamensis]